MKRLNVISLRQHYLDQVERFAPSGASQPGTPVHPQDFFLLSAQGIIGSGTIDVNRLLTYPAPGV